MTTTKSPVSTCGVKMFFSFPRSKLAALTATRPSTWFWASMIHHLRGTSAAFAENVFMSGKKSTETTGGIHQCQPADQCVASTTVILESRSRKNSSWRLTQRPYKYRTLESRSEEHTSELQSRFGISYAV